MSRSTSRVANLWVSHISLSPISFRHVLVYLLQNEFNSLIEIRNVPHFKFGPISQKCYHFCLDWHYQTCEAFYKNIEIEKLYIFAAGEILA